MFLAVTSSNFFVGVSGETKRDSSSRLSRLALGAMSNPFAGAGVLGKKSSSLLPSSPCDPATDAVRPAAVAAANAYPSFGGGCCPPPPLNSTGSNFA